MYEGHVEISLDILMSRKLNLSSYEGVEFYQQNLVLVIS